MTLHDPGDETLMAYADGMLEPAARQDIEKLLQERPELRARVEMFRKTSDLIGEAAAPLAAEPVPEALLAAIKAKVDAAGEAGNVLPLRRPPATAAAAKPLWRMAMAASLAAVIGGVAGYRIAGEAPGPVHIAVGVQPSAGIASVLDQSKSGAETLVDGNRMRLVSTFRVADTTLCREFEYASRLDGAVIAVACRQNGTWNTRFAVASNPLENGYAPASSHEAVEAYLIAVGAGSSLPEEEEEAELRKN